MGSTLQQKLDALPPERREKVEARIAQLLSEAERPITASGPFLRKCHKCGREHNSNLPPGIGVSFCSHDCAD